jgi:hypothetical protein
MNEPASESMTPNEPASGSGTASGDRSPAQVRQDLDELRGELGDTVEELANRVDVPARARAARDETVQRARRQVAHVQDVVAQRAPGAAATVRERPGLVGGIAGLVLVLLVLGGIRRRRAGAR